MTTAFEKLYKLAEGNSSNDEMYMPQPLGQDPEHQSSMDPVDPEPLEITQPKEDGNQFIGSKKTAHEGHGSLDGHTHLSRGFPDEDTHPLSHIERIGDRLRGGTCWEVGHQGCENCSSGTTRESSKKTADMSNTDENPSPGDVSAPKSVYKINVEDPPEQQLFGDAGETSRGDNSIIMSSLTLNPEARKIVHAYIAENGSPKCSVCENYYTPKSIADAKLAHCGNCPEDKIEEGDVIDGEVVKTSSKAPRCGEGHKMKESESSTPEKPHYYCPTCWGNTGDEYEKLEKVNKMSHREASTKTSNDSELYTRGFLDHLHGKPLDEDLAVLSDDYFNGYDQARYYGKTPLESVGAKPHQVTQPAAPTNSLEGWGESGIGGQDYKYDVDRSQIIASTLPTNVLEAFFNTEE